MYCIWQHIYSISTNGIYLESIVIHDDDGWGALYASAIGMVDVSRINQASIHLHYMYITQFVCFASFVENTQTHIPPTHNMRGFVFPRRCITYLFLRTRWVFESLVWILFMYVWLFGYVQQLDGYHAVLAEVCVVIYVFIYQATRFVPELNFIFF